jgi:hypothetical protein
LQGQASAFFGAPRHGFARELIGMIRLPEVDPG